jgi:uncharacterized protein YbcI
MTPERNRSSSSPGEGEPQGSQLTLSRISNEMVQAQKKYFGRGPTQAKSYLLDDFLLVVMRGGMTVAESTMLEFGRADLVRSFREEFGNELARRMVPRMQELTGRTIIGHQSRIQLDPHIVVEMFFFESEGSASRPDEESPPEG